MKNEYQSLVSPVVLSGGRPRVIQKPAMKAEYTRIPAAMSAIAIFLRENIAAAEPPAHRITADQRAAAEALQYGEYVDWSLYGVEGEENYYTANVREAIGKGNWGGTADEIAYSIANGFRNSKGHWSYVGSSKYTYMAVGVMYDGYY